MKSFSLLVAAATAALGLLTSSPAPAQVVVGEGVVAQFVFGGRPYCWYSEAWNGPGYYWCGYAFRRGFGWGGPYGWRGQHYDRPHFREPEGDHRGHH